MDDSSFVEDIRTWTVHHFSITRRVEEAPTLLRSVADALETLGTPLVHDIVGTTAVEAGEEELTVTVYLTLSDEVPDH